MGVSIRMLQEDYGEIETSCVNAVSVQNCKNDDFITACFNSCL